jgi:hypothetical protein
MSDLEGEHCGVTSAIGSNLFYRTLVNGNTPYNWTLSGYINEQFAYYYINEAWHQFNQNVEGFVGNWWRIHTMQGIGDYGNGVNGYADGTTMAITPDNHYV